MNDIHHLVHGMRFLTIPSQAIFPRNIQLQLEGVVFGLAWNHYTTCYLNTKVSAKSDLRCNLPGHVLGFLLDESFDYRPFEGAMTEVISSKGPKIHLSGVLSLKHRHCFSSISVALSVYSSHSHILSSPAFIFGSFA